MTKAYIQPITTLKGVVVLVYVSLGIATPFAWSRKGLVTAARMSCGV